jgi:hypothetical protein
MFTFATSMCELSGNKAELLELMPRADSVELLHTKTSGFLNPIEFHRPQELPESVIAAWASV